MHRWWGHLIYHPWGAQWTVKGRAVNNYGGTGVETETVWKYGIEGHLIYRAVWVLVPNSSPSPARPHVPALLNFAQFLGFSVVALALRFWTCCSFCLGTFSPLLFFWKTSIHPSGLDINVPCPERSVLTHRSLCCGALKHRDHLESCLLLLFSFRMTDLITDFPTSCKIFEGRYCLFFAHPCATRGKLFIEVNTKSACVGFKKNLPSFDTAIDEIIVPTSHSCYYWLGIFIAWAGNWAQSEFLKIKISAPRDSDLKIGT